MSEKVIKARDYLVYDYLKKVDNIIIPRYQRNYAWEKKNIEQLIYDLIREDNYYIGNIIVNDLGNKQLEVVDGQQRIITIFLMYIALFNLKKVEDINHILKNGELKINIKNRIDNSGIDVMKSIQDDEFPTSILKFNEITRYKDIKKIVNELEDGKLSLLIEHLKSANIVEIKFSNAENLSHEMFVNLNTKGKPLVGIEILKSHLFKYLIKAAHSDYYKEEWYHMLDMIGEKHHSNYLQSVGMFNLQSKKKVTEKEVLSFFLGKIDNKEKADVLFEQMTNEDTGFPLVYHAVKNHNLSKLEQYINGEPNISIEVLDEIWKMFGLIKFEHFDVVMLSYLYLPKSNPNRRKNFLKSNNYFRFVKSLKLILMYALYNNIKKVSPSNYANKFGIMANDIFLNNNNIDVLIRNLILELKIDKVTESEIKEAIKGLDCTSAKKDKRKNARELKLAKYVIQILDENNKVDLKAEHIIPESSGDSVVYTCGNIVPVISDRYADKSIEIKLEKYKQDSTVNPSLKKFLQMNPSKDNIVEIVQKRTLQIAEDYWNIFKELRDECLK